MGRKAEPGIAYYNVKVTEPNDKAIRLLIADQGTDGYWIWHCLQADVYALNGYYYNYNDTEELELFAMDKCKCSLEKVQAVVQTLVKRKLLDGRLYEQYGILTSAEIQDHYLHATSERRRDKSIRKGTEVELIDDFILIPFSEKEKNLKIVPRNNLLYPRIKDLDTRPSTHSIVEYSNSIVDGNTNVLPLGGEPPPVNGNDFLKQCYQDLEKDAKTIASFIRDSRPDFIEPYVAYWNLFAVKYGKAKVAVVNKHRSTKFKSRISEKGFILPDILKVAGLSEMLKTGTWFTFDWILESEHNYTKVLEGNYNNQQQGNGEQQQDGHLSAAAQELKAKL